MNVHKSTLVERRGVWPVNPLVVVHECSTAVVCDEWCERVTSFSGIRTRIGAESGACEHDGGVLRAAEGDAAEYERATISAWNAAGCAS
jgi:hypothetical protein